MKYEKVDMASGDIVQINPSKDDLYGGCFMVVEKVGSRGIRGSIPMHKTYNNDGKGTCSTIRITKQWDEVEWCGQSIWPSEGC